VAHSPSSKVNCCSAGEKFVSSLKHKIKYCGHKRSPLTSIFIHLNPLRARNLSHVCSDLAAPWLVACFSLRQHDCNPSSIYVCVSGRNSGTGTSFSPSTEVFPVNIVNRCYVLIHVSVTEAICA